MDSSTAATKSNIKCVIVGDGCVGKTCMLHSYTTNEFPTEHVPTIFNNLAVTVEVNDKEYILQLFDTAGQEEYDRLRVLSYPDTDIFIVTFSVSDPVSFENISTVWVPEIHHMCGQDAKFIIVGNKIDLRHSSKSKQGDRDKFVSKDQGAKLASSIGALFYCECSALTQKGLDAVFEDAILAALGHAGPTKKNTCTFGFLKKLNCIKAH